ncbi:MAG TPA: bifunctional riboflavin kinase/FAD synthetase [Niabella sp.]|nr:bifunctional riboflavin kinase/FAD synthetase [Niabella sp.]HOZ97599.1 bifunctional riboflavin kinase/FAD synthetase [Niabella sp.]HQW15737.1 bifunctional riboflavin kinase/FAD synthetase [Niabella sp.]HQX21012.1 bifunctional riboflavin kinase/FAD synthetase [Niabella sp.]HRB08198.1 bifunctional riboflavin kinase/FAD synthetase [Niabella sp.]
MQIHYDINKLPLFKNAVITIGTFDGVHEGHQKIIQQLTQTATEANGESVIITFHPHPRKVVSSSILGIRLINTLEERIELLGQSGIDHLVITPFTEVFAHQEPEDYLKSFLIDKFHPHTIIIGYDHQFGKNRRGDYRMMESFCEAFDYQLKEIPKHILDDVAISSTRVREAILQGNTTIVNHLLGRMFFFEGEVVHGDKLGRELGYPTANLKAKDEEKILPGDGIYAVYASIKSNDNNYGPMLKGMMSVGFRPTVDGSKRVIEVNIFDFDELIYGKTLRVFVKQYLRSEEKFDGLPALIKKIDEDKVESLKVL